MGTIFGREAELGRIRRVLDSSKNNRLVRAIRLHGASGTGKTTLAAAASDSVSGSTIVAATTAFRIQSSLPLFIARHLVRVLAERLGPESSRYASGLRLDTDNPDQFQEAFLRFIEGVTIDHPLLLVVDDAQWADEASRELIVGTLRSLADRPIVLLSTERTDESQEPAFPLLDESIAVGDLASAAAMQVVRSLYPNANDEVLASIVESTAGRAVDLVAVAEAARDAAASTTKAAAATTRSVIARDLAGLEPPLRAFLQICALIEEPIDFGLLRLMWEKDELLDFIERASSRYLREDRGELRFVHAAINDAVRETIPIEIPLRYRIIEALKQLPSPRLEDLERLAQQAAATRDETLERDTLLQLARAAAQRSLLSLAADAMERALQIAAPGRDELLSFFTQLSQFYNMSGRERESIRICREGLSRAREAGIAEGIGALASSLVLALWHDGNYRASREEYERYDGLLTSSADRALLLSAGTFVSAHSANYQEIERTKQHFAGLETPASPLVLLRQKTAEAFAALRKGDEVAILDRATEAEALCESLPRMMMTMPRNIRLLHAVHYRGTTATEHLLAAKHDELSETLETVLRPVLHLSKGEFPDLLQFTSEHLGRRRDTMARRILLTPYTVAAAIDGAYRSDALWSAVTAEVANYHEGQRATPLLPLTAAWLAASGKGAGSNGRQILAELTRAYSGPFDVSVFPYPFVLALAAQRLDAESELNQIASEQLLWKDHPPLSQAHTLLAVGSARAALRDPSARTTLDEARNLFLQLGMPFFAEYALSLAGTTTKNAATGDGQKTTRREREVAALVAEGKTNREIAQELVLSERTVEGHIANLFAKVNVGSRTQLAAWYLKNTSSVA